MSMQHAMLTATTDEGLPVKQMVAFHCFNPNGATSKWKQLAYQVEAMIKTGDLPEAMSFSHGFRSDYWVKELRHQAKLVSPKKLTVLTLVKRIQMQNRRTEIKLNGEAK